MVNILLSGSLSFIFVIIIIIINIFSPLLSNVNAVSNCNDSCRDLNDCSAQLICLSGRCVDDPNSGTQICKVTPPPPPPKNHPAPAPPSMMPPFRFPPGIHPPPPPRNQPAPAPPSIMFRPPPPRPPTIPSPPVQYCNPSGFLTCRGQRCPTYTCSPPVNYSNTKARLTYNDFSQRGDGGDPSTCDGKYHKDSERIVALSTGWFDGGSRCGKWIKITASNGRSTAAMVVDECDSRHGCDKEHAYQPPCKNNIVDGSDAVWKALKLDMNLGIVDVTWSMA